MHVGQAIRTAILRSKLDGRADELVQLMEAAVSAVGAAFLRLLRSPLTSATAPV